jgi:hypothetical protein
MKPLVNALQRRATMMTEVKSMKKDADLGHMLGKITSQFLPLLNT